MRARSFLRFGLPPAANSDGAERRGLDSGRRCWNRPRCRARDVHVLPEASTWSRPPEADVVGPAVAADDPHTAPDQVVRPAASCSAAGGRLAAPLFSNATRCAVRGCRLRCAGRQTRGASTSRSPGRVGRPAPATGRSRVSQRRWRRMPRPNSALSSNSELDQAGPRPLPSGVGRGRQVAAVDRRAAGGVGDQHAVAEELRGEADVRGLAAADAGAGELEQRLQQHGAGQGGALGGCRSRSGRVRKSPSCLLGWRAAGVAAPCSGLVRDGSTCRGSGRLRRTGSQPVQSSGATW